VIRLLDEEADLLKYGKLSYPLKNAHFIRRVKSGYYSLEEALLLIDKRVEEFREVEAKSKLRALPDDKAINELLVKIYKEYWLDMGQI
jgi:hypothetical protein